jgi:integrase
MILLAFRHGLRAAEVCDLRWDQIEFNAAVLHVRRVKGGIASTHPLLGDELRALRRLQRESVPSPFVFVSERGTPFTTAGFARMIERAAVVPASNLRLTRTCFAMLAVMRLPTRGMTPGRSKGGSGIGRSRARRSIRPWRRTGLRISGGSELDRRRRRPQNGLGHSDRGRSRRKR